MLLNSNRMLIMALALSGLVHAGFLLWSLNHTSSSEGDYKENMLSVHLQPAQSSVVNDTVKHTKTLPDKTSQTNSIEPVKSGPEKTAIVATQHSTSGSKPDQMESPRQPPRQSTRQPTSAENNSETAQNHSIAIRKLSGEEKRLLLGLLHSQINQYKQYPYMAIRKRREGLVKVNFVLHPDGHISDIEVSQPSRYTILDRAATNAVERVPPLEMAHNYLQHSELFNVDIEFRLN